MPVLQQGLKQERPGLAGAQLPTGILYHNGNGVKPKNCNNPKIASVLPEGQRLSDYATNRDLT